MAKVRLGVALLIPVEARTEINGLRRALGDGALDRIPPHLTLVPPVNVRDDRLPDALAVVRSAAAATRPLRLTLGPAATFSPANPVAYLAVGGALDALMALRDRVFQEPLARPLTHPFVPHVTVADDADPDRIDAAVLALRSFQVDITVDRVHVLQEGLDRVWEPIADASFSTPMVAGRGGIETELGVAELLDPDAAAFAANAWSAYSLATYGTDQQAEPVTVTARRGGEAVGVATGELTGRFAYLARLVVEPTVRGEGVGAQLLRAFEQACRDGGAERLTLRTLAGGPAEGFYRRHGYDTLWPLPDWREGRDFFQLIRRL